MSSPEETETVELPDSKITVFGSRDGRMQNDYGCLALTLACQLSDEGLVRQILEQRATLKTRLQACSLIEEISLTLDYQHTCDSVLPEDEQARSRIVELLAGRTPLSLAAEEGHTAIVRMLLENDEAVDERDTQGYDTTPLHYAAAFGHVEVVDLLLQKDADVEAVNTDGHTPLFMAIRKLQADVAELLVQKYKANVNLKDTSGHTPLVLLIRTPASGTEETGAQNRIMKHLLQAGCDVDAREERSGFTPLILASSKDRVDLMRRLLESGADVDAHCPDGLAPFTQASLLRNCDMVKLLLDHNASFDIPGAPKLTPLDHVLCPSDIFSTGLRHTGEENLLLLVELLLRKKPNLMMSPESNSLGLAIATSSFEVVKLLLQYPSVDPKKGVIRLPPLCFAANSGKGAAIKHMIEQGVSLDGTDSRWGRNALTWAVIRGHRGAVSELLATPRMRWDHVDLLGRSAIFHAAVEGHGHIFVHLMRLGSFVHRPDRFGLTPLFVAVQRGLEDLVCQILAKYPLKHEPQDRFGRSLSWWMEATGNTEVRQFLVNSGMHLPDNIQVTKDQSYLLEEPNKAVNTCEVCTLHLARDNRGIECGSGSRKYRICHVCLQFGATCADLLVE